MEVDVNSTFLMFVTSGLLTGWTDLDDYFFFESWCFPFVSISIGPVLEVDFFLLKFCILLLDVYIYGFFVV